MVVGLGNPGPKYLHTRHNVGFSVVQSLIARTDGVQLRPALDGLVGHGQIGGHPVCFCLPMTYMNRSGGPVGRLVDSLGILPSNVLVIHDDLDLPFGTVRCKRNGGHGGHNGLRDIAQHIGPRHPRIRFGIGRPESGVTVSDHVLGTWSESETQRITSCLTNAASAVEAVLQTGLDAAMNHFNVRAPLAAGQPPSKQPTTSNEVREKT